MNRCLPRLLLAISIIAAMAVLQLSARAQDATLVGSGCTAGSSSIGDPYFPLMGNSGYDVQHYTLELELNVPAGAITAGRATIEAVALVDLCAFNLDFRGLEISEVTVGGQPAGFSRNGGELTVTPATPLASGTPFTTEVAYRGEPL